MEMFCEWEARLEAWLASLPLDDAIHQLDDIEKCVEFSRWEESQK
jgi:hypothetical protein